MASYNDNDSGDEYENTQDDKGEEYGVRDGNLFIIDATPPMFDEDPETNTTYFQKCFAEYVNVLKEKLVWNRQDWMGIMLFGTEEWDTEPEIKNVKTLQSLSVVSIHKLKEAMNICDEKWKHYKDISSPTSYPLCDVLSHAAQAFCAVKVTMPTRRVILLTCQNDPQLSSDEKHRIRKRIESYADLGLQFVVTRLGSNWKQDPFYRDLELLANNIKDDEQEDYKPLTLEDIIYRVKRPARIMASLPLKFGDDVTLDIVVQSILSKGKKLRKIKLDKETHVPLQSHTYFKKVETDEIGESSVTKEKDDDNNDNDDDDDDDIPLPILASEVRKSQTFGGEEIHFTQDEVQSLCNMNEPGIEVIGTRQIQIDPMYHFQVPKFVSCKKDSKKPDNKLLFAAILDRCEKRNLMIICSVTFRRNSQSLLYSMIPNANNGGFYLYRIPFEGNVRDLNDHFSKYIYDNDEKKPPVDTELLDVMSKIIKKIRVKYDPNLFQNPKVQVQLHNLETIALDLKPRDPPPDNTLPMTDVVHGRIGNLINEFNELLSRKLELECDEPAAKKRKNAPASALDENEMRKLVKDRKVESCTAAQLKEFLKTKGLKTSGAKAELVRRILDYFR